MGGSSAESGAFFKAEKQTQEEESKMINIKVKWVNENTNEGEEEEEEEEDEKKKKYEEVTFKIEKDFPLRWLMVSYCDRIGVTYGFTRFEFKGARVRETDTPLQLSMFPLDVIFAYRFLFEVDHGCSSANYVTLCIRMHKRRDEFLRVRRAERLVPQLMRSLSDVGPQDEGPLCFVSDGSRLNWLPSANDLELDDGDIIDAFNLNENNSSLSILEPRLVLTVVSEHCPSLKSCRFTMRRTARLMSLMKRYCEMNSLENDGAIFLHGGRRLVGSKTVEEQHLEDGDEIAFLHSVKNEFESE